MLAHRAIQPAPAGSRPCRAAHIGGQTAFAVCILARGHHRLFDGRMREQRRFDFADLNAKEYSYPEAVYVTTDQSAAITSVEGDTIQSCQADLASSTSIEGSYHFFNASLGVDFTEQLLVKSENAFTRVQQSVQLWTLRLDAGRELR